MGYVAIVRETRHEYRILVELSIEKITFKPMRQED
jgi:hypothetical protein